jgi:hypothetical protein
MVAEAILERFITDRKIELANAVLLCETDEVLNENDSW